MKNKRKAIGNTVIILGIVLLLCAGGLFVYNMNASNEQARVAGDLVARVRNEIEASSETTYVEDEEPIMQEVSEQPAFAPVEIDGLSYDGYLTIPSLELEMAVFDTWNDDLLRKSLCRYYGSPATDDFVIAGHNYASGFGKLKDISVGDEVYFTDMNGNVIRYKVELIEIIGGTDVGHMIESDWDLSLYTCTYGGSDRLTVRCNSEE
jgi:sortase A